MMRRTQRRPYILDLLCLPTHHPFLSSDRRCEWLYSDTLFRSNISRHYQVPHLEKHFTITVMTMTKASEFGGWGVTMLKCHGKSRTKDDVIRNWHNLLYSIFHLHWLFSPFQFCCPLLLKHINCWALAVGANRVLCSHPTSHDWDSKAIFRLDTRVVPASEMRRVCGVRA